MLRHAIRAACLSFLIASFFLPALSSAPVVHALNTSHQQQVRTVSTDFPAVDPNYIYQQLFYMATNFQRREAGYNSSIAPDIRGHDQFADYWSKEAVRDLQGFGPQVRHDPFVITGWRGRPAQIPAFNV